MPTESIPKPKSARIHRSAVGVGQRALAVAVITQAVIDLRQSGEVTPQAAVDAARFLMERLWQNDTPWSILALEESTWLTASKVDRVVAEKLSPAAATMLPPHLRRRLSLPVNSDE